MPRRSTVRTFGLAMLAERFALTSTFQWEYAMNKGQLIEAVASELGDSKAAAQRAVDAVINCITDGIKKDEGVTIVGFGTFIKKQRKGRIGRHPITGEPMPIQPSKTVGFKASQNLKQVV